MNYFISREQGLCIAQNSNSQWGESLMPLKNPVQDHLENSQGNNYHAGGHLLFPKAWVHT